MPENLLERFCLLADLKCDVISPCLFSLNSFFLLFQIWEKPPFPSLKKKRKKKKTRKVVWEKKKPVGVERERTKCVSNGNMAVEAGEKGPFLPLLPSPPHQKKSNVS